MLFLIPGRTELASLATPLNMLIADLNAAGVGVVSDLQISLQGWNPDTRFQIRNKRGDISQILYDRQYDYSGAGLNEWLRRQGPEIVPRPDGLDFNPFAVLMGHDD